MYQSLPRYSNTPREVTSGADPGILKALGRRAPNLLINEKWGTGHQKGVGGWVREGAQRKSSDYNASNYAIA